MSSIHPSSTRLKNHASFAATFIEIAAEIEAMENLFERLRQLKGAKCHKEISTCSLGLRSGYPMEEIEDLTLSQYKSLVKGGSEIEVTLRNSTSVIVLIDVLNKSSNTNKIILHIEPKYFEAPERATGAPLNSIVHLFNELGQVLQDQKALAHLEIHGPSMSGEVFAGLQAVLKCRSLETLHLSDTMFPSRREYNHPMPTSSRN
ncbi:MAG: hypothetical protein J3Q66DRAFT_445298 [Benniella sp.]|nr:MAG: hypothetical protein J3Q66DRAFT_445298 [Benniella sp.]